jgi:hypothetical protein
MNKLLDLSEARYYSGFDLYEAFAATRRRSYIY